MTLKEVIDGLVYGLLTRALSGGFGRTSNLCIPPRFSLEVPMAMARAYLFSSVVLLAASRRHYCPAAQGLCLSRRAAHETPTSIRSRFASTCRCSM